MAFIRKRRPWDRQPQEAVEFAPWLPAGSLGYIGGQKLLLGRADYAESGTITSSPGAGGIGVVSGSSSSYINAGTVDRLSPGAATWVFLVRANSTSLSAAGGAIDTGSAYLEQLLLNSDNTGANSAGRFNLSFRDSTSVIRTGHVASTALPVGVVRCIAARIESSTSFRIAIDGDEQSVTYGGTGTLSANSGKTNYSYDINNVNSRGSHSSGSAHSLFLFARIPSNALDLAELSSRPWQTLFAPQTIWVPVSAGGGGGTTISATPGNASADGITASVVRIIGTSPGNAAADGATAAVTRTIATTPGNAAADGVTATISTAGTTTISCTPGNAVADGALAAITRTITAAPGDAVANGTITVGDAVSDPVSGGGMGFEMGGKKRRIVKIRWNGYDYTLDRDALPAFLESIEEQAEEKVTKKRNAKKKPAPLAKIVSAPADVMPDLKERIAAVNRSIGALWGTKDDEEEEEILWLMV